MIFGKGISDYTTPPEFEYILKGSIQTSAGLPQRGVAVFFDLTTHDSSYVSRSYYSTVTNDSGIFNITLSLSSGDENGVRVMVTNGKDTVRGPWVFTDSASRQEETETITTNDCNSHKKIVPVAEIYTFPPQTLILP
jgi:hypothetical protein